MLTPKFTLSQNDTEVTITISAPNARISDTDINIDENVFIFYSSPYYLRLHLPGHLVDSEEEVHKATYDADKRAFIVNCIKKMPGQHFIGLDMLTSLLTPKGDEKIKRPLIEVVGKDNEEEEELSDDEEFDWFFKQELNEDVNLGGYKYGMANSQSGVFGSLRSDLCGVVDVVDPDQKPVLQRRKERLKMEQENFEEDHYLADLFEKEEIEPCLQFQPLFYKIKKEEVEYCGSEEETLLRLPRKEILLDKEFKLSVYLGLVDILYSWCYNHRITLGGNCSESAWNIAKISSTLSWLDSFYSLKDVAISGMRRSLIYPLMRNWQLSSLVLQDTIQILLLGKKQVLKCLLETHSLFDNYDPYYILNQMYITDYCVWIQTVSDTKIASLGTSLKKVPVCKTAIDLELQELEIAAEMVIQEEKEEESIAAAVSMPRYTVGAKDVETDNLNSVIGSLDKLSVIENGFALSRNDNDNDLDSQGELKEVTVPNNTASCGCDESDSSEEEDTSDSDNSDSSSSEEDSDTSDSDDTDSSSGTSSLDSDDDIVVIKSEQGN